MSSVGMKDPYSSGLLYGVPRHDRPKGQADLTPAQRRRVTKNARRWAAKIARAVQR